jgi:hypothetical protein
MKKPQPYMLSASQQDNTTESTPTMRLKNKGGNKGAIAGDQTQDHNTSLPLKNKD